MTGGIPCLHGTEFPLASNRSEMMSRIHDVTLSAFSNSSSRLAALVLAVAVCTVSFSGCQRDERNANQPTNQLAECGETTPSGSNSQKGALRDLLAEKDAIEQAGKGVKYDDFNEAIEARKEQKRHLQPVREAIEAEMRRQCPDLFVVFDKKEELTEVQWPEYAKKLLGKRIVAVGYVEEVEPLSDYEAEDRILQQNYTGLSADDPAVKTAYQEKFEKEKAWLPTDPERLAKFEQLFLEEARREIARRRAEERWAEIRNDPKRKPCRVTIYVPELAKTDVPAALSSITVEADGSMGSVLKKGALYRLTLEIQRRRERQERPPTFSANLPGMYFELVESEFYDGDQ